jgi:hypothetical protein
VLTTGHISHNYAIKALTGLVVFSSTENRAQPDKQFADGGLIYAGSDKNKYPDHMPAMHLHHIQRSKSFLLFAGQIPVDGPGCHREKSAFYR